MRIKKILFLPVIVLAGIAYGSVKNIRTTEGSTTSQEVTSSGTLPNLQIVPAPDVTFKNEKGETLSLRSLKGKVVFINLWATWCPPCVYEMPTIHKLRQKFKDRDDLVFIMADVDGNLKKAHAFMEKNNYDLPVYVMEGKLPYELFEGSVPTTILIDKDNNVLGRQVGGTDYMHPDFIKLIEEQLKK